MHAVEESDSPVPPALPPAPTSAASVGTPRSNGVPVGTRDFYVSVGAKFKLAIAFMVAWIWLSV